jgi:hypothetical protein
MPGFNGWVRRLEGRAAGDSVTLEQVDGTVAKFEAEEFFLGLFVATANASAGVVPTGPVAEAVNNATPETRARLERMAASGDAGSFMRRAVVECGGLLAVADDAGDLSESG